jgi:type IV pilus assembly protein PilV
MRSLYSAKEGFMQHQFGFSLLEVLVALLVLSVGLMALANMQLTSIQNSRDAYHYTQALLLSQGMAERVRANRQAEDDTALWQEAAGNLLPDGDAVVCIDSTPDDGTRNSDGTTHECDASGAVYVAKIWWDHDRDAATDHQRLSVPFMP